MRNVYLMLSAVLVLAGCSGSRIHTVAEWHGYGAGHVTEVEFVPEAESNPEPEAEPEPDPELNPLESIAFPGDLLTPLENPERITFYTLAEEFELEDQLSESEIQALPEFHGYRILGTAELSLATSGQTAIDSLRKAVREGAPMSVECFFPHHGIRVEGGGHVTEILVCFECTNFAVFPDGPRNEVMIEIEEMEPAWRDIVRKHDLTDISRATWLPDEDDEESEEEPKEE